MRKIAVSALLILGLAGGLSVGQGVASADVPLTYAGVYPNGEACEKAMWDGVREGRWLPGRCSQLDNYGQYGLYVIAH